MRTLLGFLLLFTSCTHSSLAPLALFSTPSVKPLVVIEPMTSRYKTPFSEETAAIFTQSVLERLELKDRIIMESKHPQFSVKMQLVQHERSAHNPSELTMHIHLEILDLREDKPKVILQEALSSSALVEKNEPLNIDWKDASFRMSPLGLAHQKLSREIAMRIEDYILLAKKGSSG